MKTIILEKKKLFLIIGGVLLIIGTFLPWWNMGGVGPGYVETGGIINLLAGVIVLGIAIFNQGSSFNIIKIVIGIAGITSILFLLMNVVSLTNSYFAHLGFLHFPPPDFGLVICLLGGICVTTVAAIMQSKKEI